MKTTLGIAVLLFVGATTAFSQTPAERRMPTYYSRFVQSCPFTDPPPAASTNSQEINTPISNWALSGFMEMGNKKVVILQNKSNSAERLVVISGEKNEHSLEIVEIQRGDGYLKDRVRLRMGESVEGWVDYDPKFLVIKAVTPPPTNNEKGNNHPRDERRDRNPR